ncbi:hypothetical protein DFH09DRAFT_1280736 [Mycena vulgaris]|nr:hypothetical protein DFH09DRAFT_1280736 [Mycena vulgaris]
MVGGVSSDSPRTRRMRMVRGRKGGSADGEMDDGEAGTGAAMAGRGSHGLSQCHSGAAERPGGQGDARTDYKPARWLARTPLDARDIRSVHHGPGWCCHWDATNEREDRENRAANGPARWRRRRPFTSPDCPGVGESISDVGGALRGLEHSRARTQRSLARGGVLRSLQRHIIYGTRMGVVARSETRVSRARRPALLNRAIVDKRAPSAPDTPPPTQGRSAQRRNMFCVQQDVRGDRFWAVWIGCEPSVDRDAGRSSSGSDLRDRMHATRVRGMQATRAWSQRRDTLTRSLGHSARRARDAGNSSVVAVTRCPHARSGTQRR